MICSVAVPLSALSCTDFGVISESFQPFNSLGWISASERLLSIPLFWTYMQYGPQDGTKAPRRWMVVPIGYRYHDPAQAWSTFFAELRPVIINAPSNLLEIFRRFSCVAGLQCGL